MSNGSNRGWDASQEAWNKIAETVEPSASKRPAVTPADPPTEDSSLSQSLYTPKVTTDSDRLRTMRDNQYMPNLSAPVPLSSMRQYGDTERMDQLVQLGMIDDPNEGVPPMLARPKPDPLSDDELYLLANEPGTPLPEGLRFQSTMSGKTEMDLMPEESRASIGRAGIPVIYDPAVRGAEMEPWQFDTMPSPIRPEQVYEELQTPGERIDFLMRRRAFVDAFNERKEDFERQSEIGGYMLGGALGLTAGAPVVAGAGKAVMGSNIVQSIPPAYYMARYAAPQAVYNIVQSATRLPYTKWLRSVFSKEILTPGQLAAADAAGVGGSLALKKIYDQAQQIETQDEAIRDLQKVVSEMQAQEEPISKAE